MIEFKDKLKEKRIAKQLTQEELAKLLNVTRQAVSKWEQGRGIPDVTSLKKLAEILDISIDDLLSNEETKIMVVEKNDEVKKSKRLAIISVFACLGLCAATVIATVIIRHNNEDDQTISDYKAKIVSTSPSFTVDSYGESRVLEVNDKTKILNPSGNEITQKSLNVGDYVTVSYAGKDPTKRVSEIKVFDQAVFTELKGWFMYSGILLSEPNDTYSGDGFISVVQHDVTGSLFGVETSYGSLRNIKVGMSESNQRGSSSVEATVYMDLCKLLTEVSLYTIDATGYSFYRVIGSPVWAVDPSYGLPISPIALTGKRKYLSPQKDDYSPMSYDVTYLINLSYVDALESATIDEYDVNDSLIGTIPVNGIGDIAGIKTADSTHYVVIEQTYKTGSAKYTKRTAVDVNGTFDFQFSDPDGVIAAHYWRFI